MVTEKKMQEDEDKKISTFDRSLERFAENESRLPGGLKSVFKKTVKRLKSVRSYKRADVFLPNPEFFCGLLVFSMESSSDEVIEGIFRKAQMSCKCTCHLCGQPGKVRSQNGYKFVLCVSCAGLKTLDAELSLLMKQLDRSDSPKVWRESAMNTVLKLVIDEPQWILVECDACRHQHRILTIEGLKLSQSRFKKIAMAVEKKLESLSVNG